MRTAFLVILAACLAARPEPSPGQNESLVERQFQATIQPFLKTHCASCHGGDKPKAGLDFSRFNSVEDVAKGIRRWEGVLEQLEAGTMPPQNREQPPAELRREVVAWIRALRKQEAKRNAGDPGPVPARRLSNAEYNYTIRDLTGVDIQPAKEFPVDPANEAGFDNSAESLALSPALLDKYLEAGRKVADHLIFETRGLTFAEYPAVADTDRDKFCVRQIIDFYKKQRTDYADYFHAAWLHQRRGWTIEQIARERGISAKYLATVWTLLTGPAEQVGPVAAVRALWRELPNEDTAAREGCERLRDFVVQLRAKLVPEVKNLTAPPVHNGSQSMVMWKNRQMAANRRRYAGGAAQLELEKLATTAAAAQALKTPEDAMLLKQYEASFARFCSTFPDAFYISERARVYLDPKGERKLTGRLLSAGFHSMTGYFRDDGPMYDLLLSDTEQRELDRLWLDFDVITGAPMRQHTSFIWFERSDSSYMRDTEFEAFRAEDKDSTSETKIKQLAKVYLDKAKRRGVGEVAQRAIADHFETVSASIRRVEKARNEAEPRHLESLQKLAERAYRRPTTKSERESLHAFYRSLREQEGLGHEDAVRDTLVSVLVSPHFLFRLHPGVPAPGGRSGIEPLSDYALANRLSYFLWSSMPDRELLKHAAAGELGKPEILLAQARRMIKDQRIRGLATEFAGNWLDFRRFEEHNAVDRDRFKSFTDELRKAMFEEPIRFFIDVVQSDRSVLDFVYGDHTFVNSVLAQHYGISPPLRSEERGRGEGWTRIDGAGRYQRGGLLPMAVFQTKNAPGLRTSPVKRGYWVVRKILGEKIPAPPAEVPELPEDEAKLGELTLREVLARHRADKNCAACHDRFDALGLAFESYGPVGELREKDLGGRPVDSRASFPGGGEGNGLRGLKTYIRERRQNDFLEHLCRQMLSYALGRTLIPSDDDLIEELKIKLAAEEYRFGVLAETIITSRQFLNRRSGS